MITILKKQKKFWKLQDARWVMTDSIIVTAKNVGFVISVSAGDQVRIDMAQIAAQELKEIGMDVSVEIPAQTDWAGQMAFLIGWGKPI